MSDVVVPASSACRVYTLYHPGLRPPLSAPYAHPVSKRDQGRPVYTWPVRSRSNPWSSSGVSVARLPTHDQRLPLEMTALPITCTLQPWAVWRWSALRLSSLRHVPYRGCSPVCLRTPSSYQRQPSDGPRSPGPASPNPNPNPVSHLHHRHGLHVCPHSRGPRRQP